MKREFRNANVGIVSGLVVLLVGFVFLHDNEGAMELLGLGSFSVAMGVFILRMRRDVRARRKAKHLSP